MSIETYKMNEYAYEAGNNLDHSVPKVCRLCLSEELLENLYDRMDLCAWISDLLSIMVSQSDNLSPWICVLCRLRLQDFYEYRLSCMEVQEVLENGFNVIEDENNSLSEDPNDTSSDIILMTPVSDTSQEQPNENKLLVSETKRIYKGGYKGRHETCTICGKTIQRLRLEDHLNMHLGLRPYACQRGCQELFSCKYKRQVHYRKVHDGFKHECLICGRTFGSRQGLFSHHKRHHTMTTYECNICHKHFSSSYFRNQHKTMVHESTNFGLPSDQPHENSDNTNNAGCEV